MAVITQIFFLFVCISNGLAHFGNFWQDDQYDISENILSKLISRLLHPHFDFYPRDHHQINHPRIRSGDLGVSNIKRPNSFNSNPLEMLSIYKPPKFSEETSDYGSRESGETSSNLMECIYNPLDCSNEENSKNQSDKKYNSNEETYNTEANESNGHNSNEESGTDSYMSEKNKPEQTNVSNIDIKNEKNTENGTNEKLANPERSTLVSSPQEKDSSEIENGLKTNHSKEKVTETPRTDHNDSSDAKHNKDMYSNIIVFPEDMVIAKESIIKRNSDKVNENEVPNILDKLGNNQIFYAINIAPSSPNAAPYVLKPAVPSNNPGQMFFPNNIKSVPPITMQNNDPLNSYRPNNVLINLPTNPNNQFNNIVPNVNMVPNTNIILTNPDGSTTRYSLLTIPNNHNSGITSMGQFYSESNEPSGTQMNSGYYQNTNSGQEAYMVQLSNGQNSVSTNNVQAFVPNNVPIVGQENSQVLLSSNSQFISSDDQTSPQEVNQFLVSSNEQTFMPSNQNLPQGQFAMAGQNFIPINRINFIPLSINQNIKDNGQIMVPINGQSAQLNGQTLSENVISYGTPQNNDAVSLLVYKDKADSSQKENSKEDGNKSNK